MHNLKSKLNVVLLVVTSTVYSGLAQAETQPMCVYKADANFYRDSDGKTAAGKIPMYLPVQATGNRNNNFVEVLDTQKHKYWVTRDSVSSSVNCVSVKHDTVMRRGPSSDSEATPITAEKTKFYMQAAGEDDWMQLQDNQGNVGWVPLDQTWRPTTVMHLSFEDQ